MSTFSFKSDVHIFVIVFTSDNEHYLWNDQSQFMEVIEANDTTTICPDSHKYPIDVKRASGDLAEDTIIICEGINLRNFDEPVNCYKFGIDQKWTLIPIPIYDRVKIIITSKLHLP